LFGEGSKATFGHDEQNHCLTGEAIEDNIGKTLEVDAEENELAIGLFLRVKVVLDIRNPLRGWG